VTPAVPLLSAAVALVAVLWVAPPLPEAAIEAPSPVTFEAYEYGEVPAEAVEASQTTVEAFPSVAKAAEGRCTEWSGIARSEGFSEAAIDTLEQILWLESRCQTGIVGDADHGGSYGIAQIHAPTWCRPSKFYPDGYLQTRGILLTCDDLFVPQIAIRAAKAIYDYAGGSFHPWSTYKLTTEGGSK
jgi:hypothetical protein